MTVVACVRQGRRYGPEYVTRLHRAVERYRGGHPVEFVCLTDQPDQMTDVQRMDIGGAGLPGWWSKMLLFRRDVRDVWPGQRVVYLDLDTVICGSLLPLLEMKFSDDDAHCFAICENFTRRHGNKAWPCRLGSCVMVFGERYGDAVWQAFQRDKARLMFEADVYGDQRVIEMLEPAPRLLQDWLPPDYLISYRAIRPQRMPGTSIINFGGSNKPDNCIVPWVKAEWL